MKLPVKCTYCGLLKIEDDVLDAKPCAACKVNRFSLATDSESVQIFSGLMAKKMKESAQVKGRDGWQWVSPEALSTMLREHIEKGDPVDVANFCMMLALRGWKIAPPPAEHWPCWSCRRPVSMELRSDNDGDCPHCQAELDLYEWPGPVALRTVQQLRDSGHSVIIWNPDEIGTASIDALEDVAVQRGNEYLEDMREGEDDE